MIRIHPRSLLRAICMLMALVVLFLASPITVNAAATTHEVATQEELIDKLSIAQPGDTVCITQSLNLTQTISIEENITLTGASRDVVLTFNRFSLSVAPNIEVAINFITLNGEGTSAILITNSGQLTLSHMVIQNSKGGAGYSTGAVVNNAGATLIISEETHFDSCLHYVGAVHNSGYLRIEGGTITNSGPIYNVYGGTVELAGGLTSGTLSIIDARNFETVPFYVSQQLTRNVVLLATYGALPVGTVILDSKDNYTITEDDFAKVKLEHNTLELKNKQIIVATPPVYQFTPDSLTYTKGEQDEEATDLSFSLNASSTHIKAITGPNVDNFFDESDCATIETGTDGIRLTLKSSWLDTLKNGTYSIYADFNNGADSAQIKLVIEGDDPEPETETETEAETETTSPGAYPDWDWNTGADVDDAPEDTTAPPKTDAEDLSPQTSDDAGELLWCAWLLALCAALVGYQKIKQMG